jgi:hypothetical protein
MSTYFENEPSNTSTSAPRPQAPHGGSHYSGPKVSSFNPVFTAFLLAMGVPLHHLTKGPARIRFFFDDADGQASALENAYYSESPPLVDARAYGNAMNKVKRIIRRWRAEQAREQAERENGGAS